jgi:cell division protein FtsW
VLIKSTFRKNLYKIIGNVSRWSQSMDQPILCALVALFCFSILLVTAASSAAAGRIGVNEYFFMIRQVVYLAIASVIITFASMLDKKIIRRLSVIGFLINIGLLLLVKLYGYEIKGAKRWINLFGLSMQPSEFIKPFFFVLSGWILSVKFEAKFFPAVTISTCLYLLMAIFLITQPDIGMLRLISISWFLQIFVSGIPWIMIIVMAAFGLSGIWLAYTFLPHVTHRIDTFLFGDISNNYQLSKSILAYKKGGMYGLGPGEGVIKHSLPDSHTDFIFAVAGEEFGSITCMVIACIFGFIVIRTLILMIKEEDPYVIIATVGIISQFAIQAIINMSVTLNLMPTKGMTLPLISYGGSSIISIAIDMGIILSFTRKKINPYKYDLLKSL